MSKYEAPAVRDIASLHDLTLDQDKAYAPRSDGYTFNKKPIADVS